MFRHAGARLGAPRHVGHGNPEGGQLLVWSLVHKYLWSGGEPTSSYRDWGAVFMSIVVILSSHRSGCSPEWGRSGRRGAGRNPSSA